VNAPWLSVECVSKAFDGLQALAEVSCSVAAGEVVGLIGPNGAGKTTLFNVVTGFTTPERGRVIFRGLRLDGLQPHRVVAAGVVRSFQGVRLVRRASVLDNVLLAFQGQPGEVLLNAMLCWRRSVQTEAANRERALSLLHRVGLASKAGGPAEDLSYGQQKLLSLVCCLAGGPDLLLLDEPVAGIAPEMMDIVLGLVVGLRESERSVVVIEHNIDAIMQVCDRMVFMDGGRIVSQGSPAQVRNDPRVIDAYIGH
jgi:ABC-type branched-subunit amino acid transport system ATPase component